MENRPGGPYQQKESDAPTKSQLLPFLGKERDVLSKAHFIPFVIVFLLLFLLPNPFLWIIALTLGSGTYYVVYRMCGKNLPPWVPLIPAGMTMLLLTNSVFVIFQNIFGVFIGGPGELPSGAAAAQTPFPTLFYKFFMFVGLKEEFVKALPVLLLAFAAPKITNKLARYLEVHEPIDGILLATASALGFALSETMLEYVPGVMQQGGFAQGIDLLIIRFGGNLAGHVAYSGYLGYFIGLAMMRPKGRWTTIGIGWVFAAFMHTLWDCFAEGNNTIPLLLVGIVSYGLLGAAILKARQISPTRSQNFATQLYRGGEQISAQAAVSPQNATWSQVVPTAAPPPPPPPPPPVHHKAAHAGSKTGDSLTFLYVDQKFPLTTGRRFSDKEFFGLTASAGDGFVAEVTNHPSDPSILGLRNLSSISWTAWTPSGESREIPSGKTIRLAPGTTVQFGNVRGEVLG